MSIARFVAPVALVLAAGAPAVASDHPSAPPVDPCGAIQTYATVAVPARMSFAPDGTLYTGTNGVGPSLSRIGVGGSPVEAYGPGFNDPDAVYFDADGSLSGIPGAVVEGGSITNQSFHGELMAVTPDGAVVELFNSRTDRVVDNVYEILRDHSGRVLISDWQPNNRGTVKVSVAGSVPTELINIRSTVGTLAVDRDDNIYTVSADGRTIKKWSRAGDPIDANFAAVPSVVHGMTFGPFTDPPADEALFVTLRDGSFGVVDHRGTFHLLARNHGMDDLAFGPHDGLLYGTSFCGDAVYRLRAPTQLAGPGSLTEGTDGADVIWGTPGDDVIRGYDGDDVICGAEGNDVLVGNGGADVVDGGDGYDRIFGNRGADTLRGGPGPDRLYGSGDADLIDGGPGDDTIYAGGGDDSATGGEGHDRVAGNNGDDVLSGGPGSDTILGGAGSDTCDAAPGANDQVIGCEN